MNMEVSTIVQVIEGGPEGWVGCLIQVSEVKSWGIQGFVKIPKGGEAYIRLTWQQFEPIGKAVLMPTP
jgi:hypothetical protein